MDNEVAPAPPPARRRRVIRLAVSAWLVSTGVLLGVAAAYPLDDPAVRCVTGSDQTPGAMVLAIQVCTVVSFAAVGLIAAVTRTRWAVAAAVVAVAVIVAIDVGYVLRVDC